MNFANNAVCRVQGDIQRNSNLFLYWPGDPAFNAVEHNADLMTAEAERMELAASTFCENNWREWNSVEEAWKKARDAWQMALTHPSRDEMVRFCTGKIRAAADRVSRMAPGYDFKLIPLSGGFEVSYWNWPSSFAVTIYYSKGPRLASITEPSGTGKIRWGDKASTGLYYVQINSESTRRTVSILR
jgi:hypothetical protein